MKRKKKSSSEAEFLKLPMKSYSHSHARGQENADFFDVQRKKAKVENTISEESTMEFCRDEIHDEEEKCDSFDLKMPWKMKEPLAELHGYETFTVSHPEDPLLFNFPRQLPVKQSSSSNSHLQLADLDVSKKKKKKKKAKFKQLIGQEGLLPCRDSSYSEENEGSCGFSKVKKPLVEISEYESFILSPAEEPLTFSLPCENLSSDEKISSFTDCLSFKLTAIDGIQFVGDTEHGSSGYKEASSHGKDSSSCKHMLLQSKYSIMEIRLKHGEDIWSLSSQIVNPYEIVPSIAINVLNRAFFKMWELIQLFPNLVPENTKLFSAHLCEGPGGFIQSLLMYRSKKRASHGNHAQSSSLLDYHGICDTWFAITLATPISHHKALKMDLKRLEASVDEFVKGYMHYGYDGSGDITNPGNISSFVEFTLQKTNGEKMHLITGDGAFEISDDFSLQEHNHSHLLYCEMVIALQLQCLGGSFVLKLFDCFSVSTRAILCILASLYTKLEIVRLRTSRVCNSERYLVAQGFLGVPNALLDKLMHICKDWYNAVAQGLSTSLCFSKDLHRLFLSALDSGNVAFANEQIASIMQAVDLAHKLGERLSLIDVSQEKRVLSILKRKLKDIHKLKVNALLLCQALNIPISECYR